MSNHGPHFDEFSASATHAHGGAEYDEFGRPAAASTPSTGLADSFHGSAAGGSHGEHWDDFGWREMPVGHGHSFDSNFRQEHALEDGDHGTWFDVFRGGTQVKAIVDGLDVWATVLNAGDDHLLVRARDGRDLELGLQQLRAFKHADRLSDAPKPTATPLHTDAPFVASSAHAPSAHDATARGGGRTAIDAGAAALSENKVANKTAGELDVAKTLDELRALAAEG